MANVARSIERGLWTANGDYEGGARGNSLDSYADRPLQERCLGWTVTGPPMLPGAYNNNLAIYQNADHVVVINEMVHEQRIIPFDGRPQVASPITLWMGSSRGRWDGDTLVVDVGEFPADGVSQREREIQADGEVPAGRRRHDAV